MIKKWVHLTELGGDQWVVPIWIAVNEAARTGKVAPLGADLANLGLHISTRLNFLPRIARRVNAGVAWLYETVSQHFLQHESTPRVEGISLNVDNDRKYELLIDLDSLLFELNSVCDLMGKLFESLHQHAGRPMPRPGIGPSIRSVLEEAGENPSWFVALDTHRNFFIHDGAPYAAVDISKEPDDYDLLIMKENLKSFHDSSRFLRLSEINEMVQGFRRSRNILRSYLISLFTSTP